MGIRASSVSYLRLLAVPSIQILERWCVVGSSVNE